MSGAALQPEVEARVSPQDRSLLEPEPLPVAVSRREPLPVSPAEPKSPCRPGRRAVALQPEPQAVAVRATGPLPVAPDGPGI